MGIGLEGGACGRGISVQATLRGGPEWVALDGIIRGRPRGNATWTGENADLGSHRKNCV